MPDTHRPRTGDPTRLRIRRFIEEFHSECGWYPTVREICGGVGLRSSSTVQSHLDQLERDGYIQRARGCSRALRILIPLSHEESHAQA